MLNAARPDAEHTSIAPKSNPDKPITVMVALIELLVSDASPPSVL